MNINIGRNQIKIEFGLKLGSRRPRADIAIFLKGSPELNQDNVWLIVECKNEKIEPKNNKDGVGQLKSYMSACPNCEWGHVDKRQIQGSIKKSKNRGEI